MALDFFRPVKPDNPHIESFNCSFRDECLNVDWFLSLKDAKDKVEAWRKEYSECGSQAFLTVKNMIVSKESYKLDLEPPQT